MARISGIERTIQNQRRYYCFEVNEPTEVRQAKSTHWATMVDISEGGAATYTDEAFYTNELFVELHTEGYETLCGRVAREFSGGFALECGGEVERQRARQELEIFKETMGKHQEF